MCGILGLAIKDYSAKDDSLIRKLFDETMIRGKHAAGISFIKNNEVITIKEPVPADVFMSKQDISSWVNEDGNLYCIGHIRYSTSDLNYNQPMATKEISIVHNGVITQEPPEVWEEQHGYKTKTRNDSELILCALEESSDDPLEIFQGSSMAVCNIRAEDKMLIGFRNHSRPLYYYSDNRKVIFCSTYDIAKRSGIIASKCAMNVRYQVRNFKLYTYGVNFESVFEDIQP